MQRKSLIGGEVLFHEGDTPDTAYLIESGSIHVLARQPGRDLLLATLTAGDLLGEMGVVDRAPRTATAVAASDCVLLIIDSEQIDARLDRSDPILRMLLRGQMKRYRSMLQLLRGRAGDRQASTVSDPADASQAGSGIDSGTSKFRLESQLRQDLVDAKLDLRYQPVLDISTDLIVGFEALVRWTHPERGPVSPAEFIALAEETSLIVPVGEYVFDAGCNALDALRTQPMPYIAVNVSARQLAHPGLIERVVARREALRLPRGCIKVEITESQLLDHGKVAEVIAHCHSQDIAVALDDFGTGYSHLIQLHRLAFDSIKIDQAFVRDLLTSDRARRIVQTIIQMGAALGATLTAEGVETPQQLDILREMGCDQAQGYLIGKPLPLEAQIAASH